jgi:hypothetical protein
MLRFYYSFFSALLMALLILQSYKRLRERDAENKRGKKRREEVEKKRRGKLNSSSFSLSSSSSLSSHFFGRSSNHRYFVNDHLSLSLYRRENRKKNGTRAVNLRKREMSHWDARGWPRERQLRRAEFLRRKGRLGDYFVR